MMFFFFYKATRNKLETREAEVVQTWKSETWWLISYLQN